MSSGENDLNQQKYWGTMDGINSARNSDTILEDSLAITFASIWSVQNNMQIFYPKKYIYNCLIFVFRGSDEGVVDFTLTEVTPLSTLKIIKIYMCPNKRKFVLLINNSYLDSYYCYWTMACLSFRWIKRVVLSLVLFGLAVAIILLLFPVEHERYRIREDLNNTLDEGWRTWKRRY